MTEKTGPEMELDKIGIPKAQEKEGAGHHRHKESSNLGMDPCSLIV